MTEKELETNWHNLVTLDVSFAYKVSLDAMALLLGKSLNNPLSQMT